jgi:hypothetical protein
MIKERIEREDRPFEINNIKNNIKRKVSFLRNTWKHKNEGK